MLGVMLSSKRWKVSKTYPSEASSLLGAGGAAGARNKQSYKFRITNA